MTYDLDRSTDVETFQPHSRLILSKYRVSNAISWKVGEKAAGLAIMSMPENVSALYRTSKYPGALTRSHIEPSVNIPYLVVCRKEANMRYSPI